MTDGTTAPPQYDERPIFDLYAAHMHYRVVEIALRIGMFEALREPGDVVLLCKKLSIGRRAAEVLLAVLAASGLVDLSSPDARLTGIAREYLLEDSPFFKGSVFHLIPDEEFAALRDVHLRDDFPRPITQQWLAGKVFQPERQAKNMHAHTFAAGTVFAQHARFDSIENLLDVAGGAGTISIALARRHPRLRCTVMDLPGMALPAQDLIRKHSITPQVQFLGADMFAGSWRDGFDAVLFSNIFHDWDSLRCIELARRAFSSLVAGGRVFVIEMLLNEMRDGPIGPALFSAMMLFRMEGKQLTMSQLNALLATAGFSEVENIADFGYYSLISAVKPKA